MKTLTKSVIVFFTLSAFLMTSCKTGEKKDDNESDVDSSAVATKITIEKLSDSPAYETAVLQLNDPNTQNKLKSGEVNFSFDVQNYELGAQTESTNASMLANSGKGQHIHFILNNQPYSAHYEASFSKEIPDGVHHLVAFLSRSYHESVKNDNSVVVKKIMVGDNATDDGTYDMEAPTLIYSRPKGEYSGADTKNLLLDFFVLNTTLSADGNKVKAVINGEEFMIDEWAPHVIKGLPMGEVTINLSLVDANGNVKTRGGYSLLSWDETE